MKANEAPEKIYINSNIENRTWLIGKGDSSFIEYVRKDAFIEKLECWLNEKGHEYHGEFDEGFLMEFNTSEEAVADFKKYMKGE